MDVLSDALARKIRILSQTVWDGRVSEPRLQAWLSNFRESPPFDERLHALYLLSHFMFYGRRQIIELLRALFRDLYKYPIVAHIRRANSNSRDPMLLNPLFDEELKKTRFLGVGNPAESGTHLLYYFRQINGLPKNLFAHSHQLLKRRRRDAGPEIRSPEVAHYVFIDDLCASGQQASEYSTDLLEDVKEAAPKARVVYYSLFGLQAGLDKVRANAVFDEVKTLCNLDDSFRCFGTTSRYFASAPFEVTLGRAEAIAREYGDKLWPGNALGYNNGQLLLGFNHNIPDSTLPVIWNDRIVDGKPWDTVFLRYPKWELIT